MYFAVNPNVPSIVSTISASLAACRHRNPEVETYALVDFAFDEKFAKGLRRNYAGRLCEIYAGTRFSELCDLSPCLIAVDCTGDGDRALAYLLEGCSGKPMLSFMTSPLALDELAGHLRHVVEARTDDDLRWPIRFADTRIIPSILEVLAPDQRSALLHPIDGWWIVNRQGEIDALPADISDFGTAQWAERGLALSDSQFSRLVANSEADAMINTLSMAAPEALADKKPAEVFSTVRRHCLLADQYGLTGSEDRLRLALLALTHPCGASDSPTMRDILRRAGSGEPLAALLNAQPEEFWEASHA